MMFYYADMEDCTGFDTKLISWNIYGYFHVQA